MPVLKPKLKPQNPDRVRWFHKNRTLFFLKKNGHIVFCYQLARAHQGGTDLNRWWQIDIPEVEDSELVPVCKDSEIEFQLWDLEDGEDEYEYLPIAGEISKDHDGWGDLLVMSYVPESWPENPITVPDDEDFD